MQAGTTTPVAVGRSAPMFVLHDATGRSCSAPRGVPWVLAFARGWTPTDRTEQDTVRALLRGLGATLIVVAEAGVWWYRPDDDQARFAAPGQRLAADVAGLVARYGVEPGTDAAFVIDAGGVVRFAQPHADRLAIYLPAALGAAGATFRQRDRLPVRALRPSDAVVQSLVAGFGVVLVPTRLRRLGTEPPAPAPIEGGVDIVLEVDGVPRSLHVDPRTSLLEVLRDQLGLTIGKQGCAEGACGACSVLADGRAVSACLILAVAAQGSTITTVDGLLQPDAPLTPAPVDREVVRFGPRPAAAKTSLPERRAS